MELLCHETVEMDCGSQSKSRPVRAFRDAVLTQDSRVQQNLLNSERPNITDRPEPVTEHTDVQPYMRRVLTGWMLQVRSPQGRIYIVHTGLIWIEDSDHHLNHVDVHTDLKIHI